MDKDQKTDIQSPADVEVKLGETLSFKGVGDKDVYNPAPLKTGGETILAGRVESRINAVDSSVMFFREAEDGVWEPLDNSPVFDLEDPFFTVVHGEIIFGGVKVEWDASKNEKEPELITFRTVFYRGKDIYSLKQFAQGPERMKDVRLVELADGRVGIFSRPQRGEYGKGKMGFTIVDSLEEVTADVITAAPLLKDNFSDDNWGGANAAYLLPDKRLGVLGHIASKDEDGDLHYYAMVFVYDVATGESSEMKIVARRDDFPEAESKEPRLRDVIFSGGFIPEGEKDYVLYAGLSDARVGRIRIENPFAA